MANFFDTYNGDIISLNYITPTVSAKSIFIPGKTTAFDVTVEGQTAYYYESETFDISDGAAGRKLDLAETGAKRKSFDLDQSYGIGGVIPMVGHATVNEDVIGRKLMDSASGVIALDNQKGLVALVSGGTASKTVGAVKADEAYSTIVDAVVEFNKNNKVKIENGKAKGGWKAETIIVGPTMYGMLQKAPEFAHWSAGTDFSVNEALIGRVAGLDVVYAPELDEDSALFVVMNPNGFLAPKGVSATEVFGQVEGRPGAVLAQAEMVYNYKVVDANQILVHKAA